MTRKPIFWVVFTLLFIASIIFTFQYFSKAYPIVSLDLQMNRNQALQKAQDLAEKYNWGPSQFDQAAAFELDTKVQHFVELDAGGTDAFREMLREGFYEAYTWRVRHFREQEINETEIQFTPAGEPYGFEEKLPEDSPGASIPADSAQRIAENTATQNWDVDLSEYELIERSKEVRPGGRTDHTFVYERPDLQIGDGRYRLRLVVGGNRLTELTNFVKVPEAFSRRYQEMRSANSTLSSIAVIGIAILYVLGGIVAGLFFLLRQNWVLWRKPILWGFFVAFLQLLASINQWPLMWMNFDTALSTQSFVISQMVQMLLNFIGMGILLTLSFMAAESLTRKAFPNHIRFWKIWSKEVASSKPVLGRTIGGYLFVSLFFAFEVGLYFFATNVLGWWTPSDALYNPDILATYFPWLSSIAISLQAGFWEECLFRAIPIAGAALLGQRYGGRKAWIIAALIIQAFIFGAGHSNYPQQPAYARIVELIIPSLAFGGIYLVFGLLPAIITHFAFDVVWFALPLFVSSAPGNWINQLLVIILTLVPLWVVIGARIRVKKWNELKDQHFNRSWEPPVQAEKPLEKVSTVGDKVLTLNPKLLKALIPIGIISVIIWFIFTNFQDQAQPLTTKRQQAEKIAQQELSQRNIDLEDSWKTLSCVQTPKDEDDRFVWQSGGEEDYQVLMGNYLSPPRWKVRFAQFEGDVAERAEEYQVFIADDGEILRFRHTLPEARPGDSLEVAEARQLALSAIQQKYELKASQLDEIAAEPSQRPNRKDWRFTFADTINYPLDEGEARLDVKIAGNEVVDMYRYIHVPEDWQRQERNKRTITNILQTLSTVIMVLIFIAGAISGVVKWSRKTFSARIFLTFFILLFVLGIINILNGWLCTIAGFSTAQPYSNQVLMFMALPIVGVLFISAIPALVMGFVHAWMEDINNQTQLSNVLTLIAGLSVGFFIAAVSALVNQFAPALEPFWADYNVLGDAVPLAGAALNPISRFIIRIIFMLFIFVAIHRFTERGQQKKILFVALLILLGLVMSGTSVSSISQFVVSGVITGLLFALIYAMIFRYDLTLIPIVFGGMAILSQVKIAVVNAHPVAIPGAVISILLVLLIIIYWRKKLGEGNIDK